jgi:hypothetical protein
LIYRRPQLVPLDYGRLDGLPWPLDIDALRITLTDHRFRFALGRVWFTVQNKRRLQRDANSTLKCTEGAKAIILRVIHCPRPTVA